MRVLIFEGLIYECLEGEAQTFGKHPAFAEHHRQQGRVATGSGASCQRSEIHPKIKHFQGLS